MKGAPNIIVLMLCYFLANNIYVAVLGEVASDFAAPSEAAKATISAYQLGAVIACVVSSFTADYIGKLRFLTGGLLLAIGGSLGCYVAPNIDMLTAARFIQGAGAGIGFMMGFALAVDLYEPEQTLKIIAINGITVSLISAFAPYAGALIAELAGWQSVFIVVLALYSFVLINSQRQFPATANVRQDRLELRRSLMQIGQLMSSARFLSYAWLNGIFILGLFSTFTLVPFYLAKQLGLGPTGIGLFIGIATWAAFGSASLSSVLVYRRIGTDPAIALALVLGALGAAGLTLTAVGAPHSLTAIAACVTLYHLGFGLLYSGSISESLRVFKELTVKASSLRTIILSLGSFLGAMIGQALDDQQLVNLALVYLGVVVLASLAFASRNLSERIK